MLYAVTEYYCLDPKLRLIVRKHLASLGVKVQKLHGALAPRASLGLKITHRGSTAGFFLWEH